jgi:hypothetical protein
VSIILSLILNLLIALILWGLLAGIVVLAAKGVRSLTKGRVDTGKWARRTQWLTATVWAGLVGYVLFTSIYPPDGFYLAHFTEVTQRAPPPSAKVIEKNATYPDHHGHFCSHSRIALSAGDYAALLADVGSDGQLTAHPGTPTSFTRATGRTTGTHALAFLDDGRHVEVDFCVG